MSYDPQKHHRRSIRLKGYDYTQAGAYYITIVAQNRACLFGDVMNGEMILNDAGKMLWAQWDELPRRFAHVDSDEFVIMPNHIHGILVIGEQTPETAARGVTLGNIVGAWKSITTGEYIRGVHQDNWRGFDSKLWQRNYWEHIIRDEDDLNRIRQYIINNPANWNSDENNPHTNP